MSYIETKGTASRALSVFLRLGEVIYATSCSACWDASSTSSTTPG